MNEEAPQGEVPVPDVAAESSPAPVVTDKTAADASPEPEKKSGVQRRIDELTWEKSYWRDMALKGQKPEEPEPELKPPTLEQHGFDETKYQSAVVDYAKSVARKEAIEAIRAEREQERAETRAKSFKQREAEFIAKTPDYHEKVYDPTVSISQTMVELIAESPDGPGVAYYLASNRDIAENISNLSPVQAAREIGRIEFMLKQQKPEPKPVSAAPPPPPKVEAAEPEKVTEKDPSKMSDAEYAKWRKRQIAQRG